MSSQTPQTLVSTAPLATRSVPGGALVTQAVGRVVGIRRSRAATLDLVLARAVEEAFEGLARETRS